MDQVHEYQPPKNPTKLTDSRAKEYIKEYGRSSWELDALEPRVIIDLINDTVKPLIDWDTWNETKKEEKAVKAELQKLGNNWLQVSEFLSTLED